MHLQQTELSSRCPRAKTVSRELDEQFLRCAVRESLVRFGKSTVRLSGAATSDLHRSLEDTVCKNSASKVRCTLRIFARRRRNATSAAACSARKLQVSGKKLSEGLQARAQSKNFCQWCRNEEIVPTLSMEAVAAPIGVRYRLSMTLSLPSPFSSSPLQPPGWTSRAGTPVMAAAAAGRNAGTKAWARLKSHDTRKDR